MVKNVKTARNVYLCSYCLNCKTRQLQKFIFVFRAISVVIQRIAGDMRRRISAIYICSQCKYTFYTTIFKCLNRFNIYIFTTLLHIYDITSHYCIFVSWVPPWRWAEKAETGRRFITRTCVYCCVWLQAGSPCTDLPHCTERGQLSKNCAFTKKIKTKEESEFVLRNFLKTEH
jgi:hypothetical protein